MATPKQHKDFSDSIAPQLFNVANIVAPPGNTEFYEITFFQSARFYKLMRNNKNCARALKLLKQSKKHNLPVQVILTEKFGNIIDDVKKKGK